MTSTDRRQYRRHPLRHDALVLSPVACELVDVCEGGMWLRNPSSPLLMERLREAPDSTLEIHLFVAQPGNEEVHTRVAARVRRLSSSGIGVEFREPMPDLVSLLTGMPAEKRLSVIMYASQRQQLWHVVRERMSGFLQALMKTFLTQAERRIEQQLEQTVRLRERSQLNDGRYIVIDGRARLTRDFLDRCEVLFAQAEGKNLAESRDQTQVVDKAVFEDWLDLQATAAELASHHPNTLFRLNQSLSQVALRDLNDRSNPAAPILLCQCLQQTVSDAGFNACVRPLLYEAFESALTEHWPAAADALVDELTKAGLRVLDLASLPLNWSFRERTTSQTRQAPGPGDASDGNEAGQTQAAAPDGRGSLLRLVGLNRDPEYVEQPGAGSTTQVADRLRSLRLELRQAFARQPASVQLALEQVAATDTELRGLLGGDTWDRVGLVDKLFAPLATQARLRESLREQLEKLRLPVFQVLLENPGFLDDEDHPVRGVINNLMRLCLAERSSSKSLETTVSGVVKELLAAEELDRELFQRLESRLKALVERQDQAFLRNAERIGKTFDGQQRLKQTREMVQQRINLRLAGRKVPVILLDLLEAGWDQLAVLKEGSESQSLVELFGVMEQIQAWLGDESDYECFAFERELESAAVLNLVERELMTVGGSVRCRGIVRKLTAQLQDEARTELTWLADYPPGGTVQDVADNTVVDESRWLFRAQGLQIGDWIALDQGEEGSQRMRLVWGGEDVYRFVFLTSLGLREVEYDLAALVDSFRSGKVRKVDGDQVPFVDQSLYDIVQDLYREMAFRSTHDPLTGCVARHEFEKQLARLLAECRSRDGEGALISLDIDQFSVVNASYGIAAGDAVLRQLGVFLSGLPLPAGVTQVAGRLGGDEFGLAVLPLSPEQSLECAEQLRKQFREHGFRFQETEFLSTVRVSIQPFRDGSPEAGVLLNRGHLGLDAAKKAGGDRVELIQEQAQSKHQAMLSWVSRIDRTLEEGSLTLRAQRISPVAAGKQGPLYEILLGLTDGEGRSISPQGFIEAAEQYRRSSRVDRWVVDNTLAWMHRNPELLASLECININLSGASLGDDNFLSYLEAVVRQGIVPAEKLCLEVTETSVVANLHYAADFMNEMKRLNCRFALDDFGTGLSSYAYLQQLPVDFVKIDGIFVRELAENRTNYAMVRSINELSHFLGIRTIAEYVEDLESLEALRELRVDFAQGFGIARPRELESLRVEKLAGNQG